MGCMSCCPYCLSLFSPTFVPRKAAFSVQPLFSRQGLRPFGRMWLWVEPLYLWRTSKATNACSSTQWDRHNATHGRWILSSFFFFFFTFSPRLSQRRIFRSKSCSPDSLRVPGPIRGHRAGDVRGLGRSAHAQPARQPGSSPGAGGRGSSSFRDFFTVGSSLLGLCCFKLLLSLVLLLLLVLL